MDIQCITLLCHCPRKMTDYPPVVLPSSRIDSYQFLNKPEKEKWQGQERMINLHFLENSSCFEPKI